MLPEYRTAWSDADDRGCQRLDFESKAAVQNLFDAEKSAADKWNAAWREAGESKPIALQPVPAQGSETSLSSPLSLCDSPSTTLHDGNLGTCTDATVLLWAPVDPLVLADVLPVEASSTAVRPPTIAATVPNLKLTLRSASKGCGLRSAAKARAARAAAYTRVWAVS